MRNGLLVFLALLAIGSAAAGQGLSGLQAEYYSNFTRPGGVITPVPTALVFSGVSANIDHWDPVNCYYCWQPVGTSPDWYAVRWRGYIRIDVAGDYGFGTISDDGSQVWLDGALIVDNGEEQWWDWEDSLEEGSYTGRYPENYGNPDDLPGPLTLSVGYHALEVRMYEARNYDGIELWWLRPGRGTSDIPYYGVSCYATGVSPNANTNWEIIPPDVFVRDLTAIPDPMPAGALVLYAASPNPFNPLTSLRFDLLGAGHVRLEVYDLTGRRVRRLVDDDLSPGSHVAVWDGRDEGGRAMSSGSYFARLATRQDVRTVRLSLVR